MASGSFERKSFSGGALPTALNAAISGNPTSFTVSSGGGSTYPDGSAGPFVVVIDRNSVSEEKILVTSRVGDQFNIDTRGYDNTVALDHDLGAVVEHVLDASTIDQANRYVNLQTTKGSIVAHDGTNAVAVPAGANNTLFVADSAQTAGVAYKSIATLDIATASSVTSLTSTVSTLSGRVTTIEGNNWVTTTRILNGAVTDAKLAEDYVKQANGTVTAASTSSNVVRNIRVSTGLPTGGADGDVWMVYS